jgi:DNA-directed RNA polymerase subunit beta'
MNLATNEMAKVGEAVGIIAAQSIGEPGTQLTMRTFHVGGVASGTFKQPIIKVKAKGVVHYNNLRIVETPNKTFVALNKNGTVSIHDKNGLELESYNIVSGSEIRVADNAEIKKGATLATWDPYSVPVITEKPGKIVFRDMIQGITLDTEIDKETNTKGLVVIEHKEDLHPQIIIVDPKTKEELATYSIPTGAHLSVKEGAKVDGGDQLAKTPRKVSETKDITGGLPRVAELFEARKPKEVAEIAKIDGEVSLGGTVRAKRKLIVTDNESGEAEEHLIPLGKHYLVQPGDMVHKGQKLTEGAVIPHDILEILGSHALMEHLVSEVQDVYRLQGVEINDKHIEIIIRQMLRKVRITDPGDTQFLWGDQIEKTTFEIINEDISEQGGKPAEGEPVLLGITKASLETDSFISAASFQDTTRVLTEASTLGKVDYLRGFKENVIMGHLIPAGTGFHTTRNLRVEELVDPSEIIADKEADAEEAEEAEETA